MIQKERSMILMEVLDLLVQEDLMDSNTKEAMVLKDLIFPVSKAVKM